MRCAPFIHSFIVDEWDTSNPTAVYNANNQLTQWGTVIPTYDKNGNTLSDGMNTYSWDARNRLQSANNNGAVFSYDPLGRRVSKTIQTTTTNFLYDGVNAVQEYGANPTANLLTGGVDERFTRTTSAETDEYLTDALGSTVELTNATGATEEQYSYSPYGVQSASGATTTNSYTYTGREFDGLGIDYFRARYYNPITGRFLSEDPIGFRGGINKYAYAGGSPTNFIDPFGLDVTVAYYPNAAGGQGHVGIGINTDSTQGFYPASFGFLSPLFNVPGGVFNDASMNGAAPVIYLHLQTTPEQDQAMLQAINQRIQNPGKYNLSGRNCAMFVEDVLQAGNVINSQSGDYHPWYVYQWLETIGGFY